MNTVCTESYARDTTRKLSVRVHYFCKSNWYESQHAHNLNKETEGLGERKKTTSKRVLSQKLSAHAPQAPSKEPSSASYPGSICPLARISTVTRINQRATGALSASLSAAAWDVKSIKPRMSTRLPALETASIFFHHGRRLRSAPHVPLPRAHLPSGTFHGSSALHAHSQ